MGCCCHRQYHVHVAMTIVALVHRRGPVLTRHGLTDFVLERLHAPLLTRRPSSSVVLLRFRFSLSRMAR